MGVTAVALQVHPNEPAYAMIEGPHDGRWMQRIWVQRGGHLACYETDIGPAEDYAGVSPLIMPGLWEESVASLQEHGARHRLDDRMRAFAQRHLDKVRAESTLIKDILRQEEEGREWIMGRSVFGPAISRQRNAYDRNFVRRRIRDRRKEYTGIIPQGGR